MHGNPLFMKLIPIAFCTLFLLAGCGQSSSPTAAANDGVQKLLAGLPESDSDAAKIFVRRCNICHLRPQPTAFDAATWPKVIGLMKRKMANLGVPLPPAQDEAIILDYLRRNARPPEARQQGGQG